MKYVKEATLKTKALPYYMVNIMMVITYGVINAKILIWISDAVSNYQDPLESVRKVILGCVAATIINPIQQYTGRMAQQYIFSYLCNEYAEKLLYSDYEFFVKNSPGRLLTIEKSIDKISKMVKTWIQLLSSVIEFSITLVAMFLLKAEVIIPVMVLYGIGGVVFFKIIKKWNSLDQTFDDEVHSRSKEMDEIINGFKEIQTSPDSASRHEKSIKRKNLEILKLLKKRVGYGSRLALTWQIIDGIGTIAMLGYILLSMKDGAFRNSDAMALIMYLWRLVNPIIGMAQDASDLSEFKEPLRKYSEALDYRNTVSRGNTELESFDREIRFEDVEFSYDKSSMILDGVNFSIKKGEHIGICGTTGGGKSTLLKLIPKFYDVDWGSIKIDGIDIRNLTTSSIRKHIGIVHQDPYMFDASIADNIGYGIERTNRRHIEEAAKKASIYDFIESLPEGFDTVVGPRGLKLSGGQKQRIALARVFLSNPDIVILDEATSALDNETESAIQESLNEFRDKTMITVAHRLSTIKDSDKIVVIDEHKVAEIGTHEELVAMNGIYASMLR